MDQSTANNSTPATDGHQHIRLLSTVPLELEKLLEELQHEMDN